MNDNHIFAELRNRIRRANGNTKPRAKAATNWATADQLHTMLGVTRAWLRSNCDANGGVIRRREINGVSAEGKAYVRYLYAVNDTRALISKSRGAE